MRVSGDGAAVSRSERADVSTRTDRFEKPGERVNAARARTVRAGRRGRRHGRLYQGEWGGGSAPIYRGTGGVGVWVGNRGA